MTCFLKIALVISIIQQIRLTEVKIKKELAEIEKIKASSKTNK